MVSIPATPTFNAGPPAVTPANMNGFRDCFNYLGLGTQAAAKPECSVYKSANSNLTHNNWAMMTWDTVRFNTDSMHPSSDRITATTAGLYEVTVRIRYAQPLSWFGQAFTFRTLVALNNAGSFAGKDSHQIWQEAFISDGTAGRDLGEYVTYTTTEYVTMTAGDYLEVWVYQDAVGAGVAPLMGGISGCSFSATWVGGVNVSAPPNPPPPSDDTTAPTPPTLTAGAVSGGSVTLTWSGATDNVGVTSYLVFRNGVSVASPTASPYTDTGLLPSTAYSYYVKAVDAAGNLSPASNTVTVQAGNAEYYVAPTGSDSAAGTFAAPFQTLGKAQTTVRAVIAAGQAGDITVYLRDGKYYQTAPLAFTELDSGTSPYTITWRAYQDEKPVIVGGTPVTG